MEIKSLLISYVTEFNDPLNPPTHPLFPLIFQLRSTYQRMSLQLSESYGLRRRAPSRPATPLPDLTILPHEPIHQLKGEFPPYVIRVRPSARAEKQLNAASICQVFCFPTWYSPLILRSSWMEQISPLESCSSILPISRRQHVNGA